MLGLTLAVALHSQPYGENGLLVTLYSPKEGLMRGIARGSRTPSGRQRYSALLHPMALVELQYKAARREEGLYTLHDAEAQCALTVMLNEPKRMFVALFCSEVLLLLLRNAPGNLETYELAKGLVLALNDAEKGVAWLPTWFLLRLACVLGYAPSGRWSEADCHFDPENGCFTPTSYGVHREESQAIGMLLECEKRPREQMPVGVNRASLLRTLLAYLGYHSGMPCEPKSLPILEELLH